MANNRAVNDYDKTNIETVYNDALKALKDAYNAAISKNKEQESAQKEVIKDDYDAKRNNTYVNARLSAIGNNENLAANGLAGGLYNYAKSGVSETSRIAQDNTLRNNINNLSNSEQQDIDELSLEALLARYDADRELAKETADLLEQKAEDLIDDNQFAAQFDLNNYKAYLDALKLQNDIGLNALSSKTGRAAAEEIKKYGKVVNADTAELLGVPIGTSAANVLSRIIAASTK